MVSHFAGSGVYAPWAWRGAGAASALLRCLDFGMVPRGPSVVVGFGARGFPVFDGRGMP